jgi:steroid 5-alpha reductase family enzyme
MAVDQSRWLATVATPDYWILSGCYVAFMTFLWWLRRPLRNAGLVDFGWPCGLLLLAAYFYFTGTGWVPRRAILCGMYAICSLRFVAGWLARVIRDGEDRRYGYWRRHWEEGNGLFGIRSADFNFLIFYYAQAFANLLVVAAPLGLAATNPTNNFHYLEIAAIGLWVTSFALENVADYQLDQFRKSAEGKAGVCRRGLWGYSRHPNYFFEFLLWVAYALYAWPSISGWLDGVFLVAVVGVAYWFLVYYTGIPLTERASLERRGEAFRQYQAEVSFFIPWFPKRRSRQ